MSAVIKVDNISKLYRLGMVGNRTIVEDINRLIARIRGKENPYLKVGETNQRNIKGKSDYVWALKDINFEVEEGQRFGIIGKNGAGKSTLLKILSRVAGPTKGTVKLKGRVASLLEVGTGFHPELTGRDNVFLNGAILGMTQEEIKGKFDSIVDFSGVERYIDTPVKRYSSGMYVRLAFAVAAHLEPEILIVDEVLAVGDAEFQKKCLGKMHDVSEKEGRTVLFVSHNLQAIRNLCQKTVILNNGELFASGNTEQVLKEYNELSRDITIKADTEINNNINRRGKGRVRFTSIDLTDESGNRRYKFEIGEKIRVKITFEIFKEIEGLTFIFAILSGLSRECLTLIQYELSRNKMTPGQKGEVTVEIPDLKIKPGEYPLYFELTDLKYNNYAKDVIDDLTAPLEITEGKNNLYFEDNKPSGYFRTESNLLHKEIYDINQLSKV
ncbi:MAG TPA: ABC transporter ATP-binding protein [Ignavibacteria bacterium]|nr:ABC transporter ATP-binding protein [Bacteroidota bacterium]HRI83898.1 ABC transporter ATP-binding protein [Ignavibacteria bacterium]HRJ98481.1 ABC transporter ATP-binding protein [Ignavibacteria bacterium]